MDDQSKPTPKVFITMPVTDVAGTVVVDADEFLRMVEDHRDATMRRHELINRKLDAAAKMVVAGMDAVRRRSSPLATDFSADVDSRQDPVDAGSGSTPPTPNRESARMTYAEAAAVLNCSPSTIYQMARDDDGRLSRVGKGRGAQVTRESVEAYLRGERP